MLKHALGSCLCAVDGAGRQQAQPLILHHGRERWLEWVIVRRQGLGYLAVMQSHLIESSVRQTRGEFRPAFTDNDPLYVPGCISVRRVTSVRVLWYGAVY